MTDPEYIAPGTVRTRSAHKQLLEFLADLGVRSLCVRSRDYPDEVYLYRVQHEGFPIQIELVYGCHFVELRHDAPRKIDTCRREYRRWQESRGIEAAMLIEMERVEIDAAMLLEMERVEIEEARLSEAVDAA